MLKHVRSCTTERNNGGKAVKMLARVHFSLGVI